MRLATLKAWGESEYPDLPDRKTLLRHAQELGIAVNRCGSWYVDTMRPRKAGNRDLPPNLYRDGNRYRYRHPQTGKRISLGSDKEHAISIAIEANSHLEPRPTAFTLIIDEKKIEDAINIYRKEIDASSLAKRTKGIKIRRLRIINNEIGQYGLRSITLNLVAEYLEKDTWNYFRTDLIEVFSIAVAKGWCDDNLARKTRKNIPPKKKHPIMSIEQYQEIHDLAPDWLQVAMDLSLDTTQRVSDVLLMRFNAIENGAIPVIQQKTGKAIMMSMGPKLAQVVDRAKKIAVISPYIVRASLYGARKTRPLRAEYLQTVFRGIVKGLYDPYPTFHEIRGLGHYVG